MTMIARNVLLLAALSTTWACSSGSGPVDLGDSRTGEKLGDYAAVWEGYVEAHDFADGSDKVRLSVDASGNGTLEIGDTARLPAPTRPDLPYPPNASPYQRLENLFPGISYPISTATIESARLRFSVNPWEVDRDWCALQTSYSVQDGPWPYGCLPVYSVNRSMPDGPCSYGTAETPVDCAKAEMCTGSSHVCACDAQGCSVLSGNGYTASYTKLDAALDDAGNSLIGTLRIGPEPVQQSMTVRLKRISSN